MTARLAGFALIAALLISALAGPAAAEEYRDETYHFSLTIPSGWRKMTGDELEHINGALTGRRVQVNWIAGFRPKTLIFGGYPYVLVQVTHPRGRTFEQIEKEYTRDTAAETRKHQDGVKGARFSEPSLDREHRRIVAELAMEVAPFGKIKGHISTHLGKEGAIGLYGYAVERDYAKRLKLFEELDDSFHFDEGFGFKPATLFGLKIDKADEQTYEWIGLAIGGVAVLAAYLFHKWQS